MDGPFGHLLLPGRRWASKGKRARPFQWPAQLPGNQRLGRGSSRFESLAEVGTKGRGSSRFERLEVGTRLKLFFACVWRGTESPTKKWGRKGTLSPGLEGDHLSGAFPKNGILNMGKQKVKRSAWDN